MARGTGHDTAGRESVTPSDRLFDLHATHAVRFAARVLARLPVLPDGRVAVVSRLSDGPSLVLTFDDGPSPSTTPALLDTLATAPLAVAPVTFFVLGDAARAHPALARRIADAGHRVGLHGPTHTDLWRRRLDAAAWSDARGVLEDITGAPVDAVRPPYGHLTPALLAWARRSGLPLWLWDVMPGDFRTGISANGVVASTRRLARAGSIVALHEGAAVTDVVLPAVRALLR